MRRFMFMSRVITLVIAATLCLSQTIHAQQNPNSQTTIRDTFANEAITVAATAIGFTAATINPTCTDCPVNTLRATLATCVLETADIRILTSGTDPTSAVGILITAGQSFLVYGYDDISAFRAIRTGGSSGALTCQYSRVP